MKPHSICGVMVTQSSRLAFTKIVSHFLMQDPLLMYPHNQGIVRDFQSHPGNKSVGARSSSFHCHLQQKVEIVKEGKKTFQSHVKKIEDNLCQSHMQQEEKIAHVASEVNLIEL
jgi:hypothetical protein